MQELYRPKSAADNFEIGFTISHTIGGMAWFLDELKIDLFPSPFKFLFKVDSMKRLEFGFK